MTPKAADTTLTDAAARLRMAIVRTSRRLRQEAAEGGAELTRPRSRRWPRSSATGR